jgi:hypothetical protein
VAVVDVVVIGGHQCWTFFSLVAGPVGPRREGGSSRNGKDS